METLASQAEISVWVQARAGSACAKGLPTHCRRGSPGVSLRKKIEIVYEKSYNHAFPLETTVAAVVERATTYPGSRAVVSIPFGVCWSLESILIISMATDDAAL